MIKGQIGTVLHSIQFTLTIKVKRGQKWDLLTIHGRKSHEIVFTDHVPTRNKYSL